MRVLITGGYGFIGSHVAERFHQEGDDVFILDNLSTGRKENIDFKHRSYILSIEDMKCEEVFRTGRFDIVIHLAAQTSVAESVGNPSADTKANVLGLTNMLSLAHKHGVKKFIMASSAAVYGLNPDMPLSEAMLGDPVSPYGMSKWTGEMYCRKWQEMYGLETLIFRFSNVYGPRQGASGEGGVVSIFLEQALADKELTIFGDGGQTRDFIFVGDVADAVYRSSYSLLNGLYNLSTKVQTNVNELVDSVRQLHGSIKLSNRDARTGDIYHSVLDNKLICRDLDWTPRYGIGEGLALTYRWFREKQLSDEASNARSADRKESTRWVQWIKPAVPYIENALLFAIIVWISGNFSDSFNLFFDPKLFYILVIGIVHGNRQSIIAVVLSTVLFTQEQLANGRDLVSLLYVTDYFFQIAIYLFIGLVVGYTIERRKNQLLSKQREINTITEKHAFLTDVYKETRQVKEELQQQIMNNSDSFGKIYSVTKELESLEPEQIFTSTVSVVESILKTDGVSIYTVNKYGSYLRLVAKSNGSHSLSAKSVKVEDSPYLQTMFSTHSMFVNKQLEQGMPLLAAPVISQGQVIAVIILNEVKFERFTTYYHNLFKITVDLVSSALSRALSYVEATVNQRFIEGTTILKPEIFKDILESKITANQKHGIEFVLMTPATTYSGIDRDEMSRTIAKSLRETDYMGIGQSGELLVLLSNSSHEEATFVLERFHQNGIYMNFIDKELHYVG